MSGEPAPKPQMPEDYLEYQSETLPRIGSKAAGCAGSFFLSAPHFVLCLWLSATLPPAASKHLAFSWTPVIWLPVAGLLAHHEKGLGILLMLAESLVAGYTATFAIQSIVNWRFKHRPPRWHFALAVIFWLCWLPVPVRFAATHYMN
jgi:hypothetical protein